MTVTPNPFTTCQITGVENSKDLIITDVLGRKLNSTFNKSENGYYLTFPETSSGIFIIRNIKTGQVVKFVKE
ncbi:hypothetical protein LBMAG27_24640 [Bacteroidota bacterium]|nr:hypothetical protein LBMAG27_24640 [Bacteroidota bacterium]